MMQSLTKKEIRLKLKHQRECLSNREVLTLSKKIFDNLKKLNFEKFDNFFVYKNFRNEAQTEGIVNWLFKNKKRIFMPKIIKNNIKTIEINKNTAFIQNKFEIFEPVGNPENIDNFVAIMPCLAVSKTGIRIGFGGGFYDRFLSNKNALKIVICFDFQVVNDFDAEEFDVPVDIIITEKRIIYTKKDYTIV